MKITANTCHWQQGSLFSYDRLRSYFSLADESEVDVGHIIVIVDFEHLPLEIAEGVMVGCLSDDNITPGVWWSSVSLTTTNHEVAHKGTNTYRKELPDPQEPGTSLFRDAL